MSAPAQQGAPRLRALLTAPVVGAVLLVVGAAAAVLAGTRLVRAWTDPYVIVHAAGPDAAGVAPPPGLPPGSAVYGLDVTFMVRVDDVPLPLRLLAATGRSLSPLALAIGALAVALLLDALARRPAPPTRHTPALLALLAGAVALGGLAAPLLTGAAGQAVLTHAGVERGTSLRVLVDVDLWWLAVTVGVVALVPLAARGRTRDGSAPPTRPVAGRSAA